MHHTPPEPKVEPGASRLQQIANVLKVPVAFFFGDAPAAEGKPSNADLPPIVTQFLSTKDGLALAKAYMALKDKAVRKRVVELVVQVARP